MKKVKAIKLTIFLATVTLVAFSVLSVNAAQSQPNKKILFWRQQPVHRIPDFSMF